MPTGLHGMTLSEPWKVVMRHVRIKYLVCLELSSVSKSSVLARSSGIDTARLKKGLNDQRLMQNKIHVLRVLRNVFLDDGTDNVYLEVFISGQLESGLLPERKQDPYRAIVQEAPYGLK